MNEKHKVIRTSISTPAWVMEGIDKLARRRAMTRSSLVRETLIAAFDLKPPERESEEGKGK